MELNFPIKIQFLSIATHLSPQKHFYYQEAVTLTEMELFQLNAIVRIRENFTKMMNCILSNVRINEIMCHIDIELISHLLI